MSTAGISCRSNESSSPLNATMSRTPGTSSRIAGSETPTYAIATRASANTTWSCASHSNSPAQHPRSSVSRSCAPAVTCRRSGKPPTVSDAPRRGFVDGPRLTVRRSRGRAVSFMPDAYGPCLAAEFLDLTRELFASQQLSEIADRALRFALECLPGYVAASVTIVHGGVATLRTATDLVAEQLDLRRVRPRSGYAALQSRHPPPPRPYAAGRPPSIELAYSLMMTLPGTPVLRYGDEIGMGDNLKLPERTACTPMQWSSEPQAGFTTSAKPVLPLIGDGPYGFQHVNVADQRRNPDSLLNWMERIIRMRKEVPGDRVGRFRLPAHRVQRRVRDDVHLAKQLRRYRAQSLCRAPGDYLHTRWGCRRELTNLLSNHHSAPSSTAATPCCWSPWVSLVPGLWSGLPAQAQRDLICPARLTTFVGVPWNAHVSSLFVSVTKGRVRSCDLQQRSSPP